jgi:hypothetical protein
VPAAVMMRRAEDGFGEHSIGQRCPGDGPGDLARYGGGPAEAVTARSAAAQEPVGGGEDRVEVRAPGLDEHQDQHAQAHGGHQRVDQQAQRAIGGQPGGGDAGPDHDRDEQASAGELGQQLLPTAAFMPWRA